MSLSKRRMNLLLLHHRSLMMNVSWRLWRSMKNSSKGQFFSLTYSCGSFHFDYLRHATIVQVITLGHVHIPFTNRKLQEVRDRLNQLRDLIGHYQVGKEMVNSIWHLSHTWKLYAQKPEGWSSNPNTHHPPRRKDCRTTCTYTKLNMYLSNSAVCWFI